MILDGKMIAEKRNDALKNKISKLVSEGYRNPRIVIIQVGDNPASNSYIKGKLKACADVGIKGIHLHYNEDINDDVISEKIKELNMDSFIDGMILQLPLPKHLDEDKLTNLIDHEKDIDGFHILNKGLLFEGKPGIRPATPQGIINLLDEYNIDVSGMNAVIVGRSNLVGMPVAKMLLDRNATITICHSKTKNLKEITKQADLLVAAIGKRRMITEDMVKIGAIIIDVGINKVDGKLYGDVDFDKVSEKAKYITPVPKGVGPMTISALLENSFNLFYKKNILK